MWRKLYLVVFVKLFFIFLLPILTYFYGKISLSGFFVFSTEILFVLVVSSFIALKLRLIASVISCLVIFCLESQLVVLFFSNSFINLNMIDNISSFAVVAGSRHVFLISIVILSSCIPPHFINLCILGRRLKPLAVFCSFCFLVCLWLAIGTGAYRHSGIYQYLKLIDDYIRLNELRAAASKLMHMNKESFWKPYVADGIDKPHGLPDKPNIILIFTEGLSENIISDSRMIMPNLSNFRKRSLDFKNYYNHTFATYMGVIGSLYSGYQQNNFDVNNLVSLQGILKNQGYKTVFLNVQPHNNEFTAWVERLGFDETLSNVNKVDGIGGMSDRSAYEFLWEKSKKYYKDNKPFFICIYTLGTHAAFDGIYKKFGDGKSPLLNRFYENDYWFGEFLRCFDESNMSNDTMIVFTSDHATYADGDFYEAFPDYVRSVNNLDKIPLFFYFNGWEQKVIDVQGRNSLDLAPSILDFLDITEGNFFLGETLFKSSDNSYSTIFQSLTSYYNTKNSVIVPHEDKLFEKDLMAYFSLKGRDASLWKDISSPYAVAERNMINGCVEVKIQNVEKCDMLRLAIWSENNGQDDLQWIEVPFESNIIIDSTKFKETGVYNVHIFRVENEAESFATWTTLFVDSEDVKQ